MVLVQKELKNAYIGEYVGPGIFHNSDLGLISLSSDGSNWLTISDKNLGATTVYNSGDALSEANCGKYYQRGNNYGFPFTGSVTTSSTQVNASTYGPGNYYSSSTFITANPRDSSANANLWGYTTGTNEAMQGPCATGYHIPTNTEWGNIYNMGINNNWWTSSEGTKFGSYLKLPMAGYRAYSTSNISSQGTQGAYLSSAILGSYARGHFFTATYSKYTGTASLSNGASIRPFKNEAVQPDTSWTKLY